MPMSLPDPKSRVDFGIITIRDDEFQAVLRRLPEKTEHVGKRQRYFIGQVMTHSADNYRVAVVRCIEQGTGEAQHVANALVEDLSPQWLIVVGIAGGLPTPEFTLGDVIVSTRIYDLNLEAVLREHRTYGVAGGPLVQEAANVVACLPGKDTLHSGWNSSQSLKTKRPSPPTPTRGLYGDPAWKSKVKESLNLNKKRRLPRFTTGAIASSDRLIKDDQIASDWLEFIRPMLAIEMESAGIYRLAHSRQIPFIAIRGISDIVGLKREPAWTNYACNTAAAFTFAFLETRPIEPLSALRDSHGVRKEGEALPPTKPTHPPTPHFQTKESEQLHNQIQKASKAKQRLQVAGVSTEEVDREIHRLRSRYREGGQLREGDRLGERYLLIRRIDMGGFATVWEAFDEQQQAVVAIKVLHSPLAHDPVKLERFFRGARIMADLSHDSIVRVLQPCTEDGGYYFFVMEYIPGGNLKKAVMEKRLQGTDAIIPIILRVGDALAHAHARSLVHRDVKPANILLDGAGAPRLTDFDLVGGADVAGGTRTNSVVGTPLFAAPELMDRPQDAGPSADVYSLGMTALFGLYGKEFTFNDKFGLARIISRLDCNSAVKAVLKKSIATAVNARFPNAAAFCDALKKAYELPLLPSVPTEPVAPTLHLGKKITGLPKRRYGVPRPTRHKLLKAMAEFDHKMRGLPNWANWEHRSRQRYAIEHEGRHYPVKVTLSLASGRPTWSFSGGDDANEVVRKQGFVVVDMKSKEPIR